MVSDPRDASKAAEFKRVGYCLLPGLIGREMIEYFWSYAHTKFASRQMSRGKDLVATNSLGAYGDAALDGLLEFVRPRIAAAAGVRLLPTYSMVRMYHRGDALTPHRDRRACEISVSLNIGQAPEAPWPIVIEGPQGSASAVLLPGDAVIYRGIECRHWREPYEGDRLVQVFLHYVDADGPFAAERFDRRSSLMRPKSGPKSDDAQAAP